MSIINGETDNHTIQGKEPTKNEGIFEMDDSAVILSQRIGTTERRRNRSGVVPIEIERVV